MTTPLFVNCSPLSLRGKFTHSFTITVGDCSGRVRYLEHIHAKITLKYSRRGDVQITLTSPMGTRCTLLPPRPRDNNNSGFHQWPFLSVHQWGEDPRGDWTLTVENAGQETNHGVCSCAGTQHCRHVPRLVAGRVRHGSAGAGI